MSDSVVTAQRRDASTTILTLNRPERRNALSIELLEALRQSLDQLAQEPQQRVAILRGAGPAFCAGLDLLEAAQPELAERSAYCLNHAFHTLAKSPLITIAAVHGAAYAGGVGLLACCDLAVAADDLKIAFPEVRRGLVPALAGALLYGRLRDGDLRELLLLGEPVGAERALQIGLVQRVVALPRLIEEAEAMAAAILRGGPAAVRQTKRLLHEFTASDAQGRFARALASHSQARLSDEAREGLAAFREHRDVKWREDVR